MKILWLNANLLLPLDKGGKLRTWHLMRHLAKHHSITYVSFVEPGERREHLDGMSEVCDTLVTVPRADVCKGSFRFYADAASYLVDRQPYAVAKYRSPEYAACVQQLLAQGDYELVVCDFLVPLVNMPAALPCPAVLFTHNVEAEIWRRHAETATNPVGRRLLATQWRRMLRFERAALARFDLVLTVSEADSVTFSRLYDGAASAFHVVPTGVDTEYFAPLSADSLRGSTPLGVSAPLSGSTGSHLVFTGSMDWLPNEDGMLFFVREILPRIRAAEPDATLSIVGRAPTPAVKRLADEHGITVTGRVDDVRPHVGAATVYVVPLRIGGGTRLKIFEAMSMGKAVVSTTVGAEGLPVTSGRDILIADTPAEFATSVVNLLRNREERQRLERAARQLVTARYDWSAVARDLEAALGTAANGDVDVAEAV